MRKILASTLLIAASSVAFAKPPSPRSDWTHVQVLATGTKLHIKTLDHGSIRCAFSSADTESVTCGGVSFKRSSILYIKSSHRTRSALVGVAVGYGAAVALTTAYAESCKSNCRTGTVGAIAVVDLAAVVATPITFGFLDLTAGTIYKAPTP